MGNTPLKKNPTFGSLRNIALFVIPAIVAGGLIYYFLRPTPLPEVTPLFTFENIVAYDAMPYFYDNSTEPGLVYFNSVNRSVELRFENTSYSILPNTLTTVNELAWYDQDTAIVTIGNLMNEKKDYILDLSTWSSVIAPTLTLLPFHGENFTWDVTGESVAYFGNIDPRTGTTTLNTYNITTNEETQIGNIVISGPVELVWDGNENFFVLEESEGGYEDLAFHAIRKAAAGLWTKERFTQSIPRTAVLNDTRTTLLYADGIDLKTLYIPTFEITTVASTQNYGANFVYTYSPSDEIFVLYQDNEKFFLTSISEKPQTKELSLLSGKSGILTEFIRVPSNENLYSVTLNNQEIFTFYLE